MDFSLWASAFPGLLWEIEHRRSRLRLLNGWEIPVLGSETARLLKDVRFRRRAVLKTDLPLLGEFWDMMTNSQPAAVSFRLSASSHQVFLLQGWPHPQDPGLYLGMLKEAVQPATFVANGAAGTCQLALGRSQYPVLVLSIEDREIITCNESAEILFSGMASDGLFFLKDIAPGTMGDELLSAASRALEEDIWAGTLMLRSRTGSILGAKVRISPCTPKGGVVRIALLNTPDLPVSSHHDTVPAMADEVPSLKDGLNDILARCPGVDGLMFSDIQSTKGKVEVYGVGRLFASLPWGASHAYEGTIAQDIERFGLESLLVEDTLDSIKSIDWALFIPCGVRSYFARPFYRADGLHAVLIFAFADPCVPDAVRESEFRPLYSVFSHLIEHWRMGG